MVGVENDVLTGGVSGSFRERSVFQTVTPGFTISRFDCPMCGILVFQKRLIIRYLQKIEIPHPSKNQGPGLVLFCKHMIISPIQLAPKPGASAGLAGYYGKIAILVP